MFITQAREQGAALVLVTSMLRRNFGPNGKIVNTLLDYPDAMRETTVDRDVPCIDLNARSRILYETLSVEGSKKAFVHYPAYSFPGQNEALQDNSHISAYGAYRLAQCVVRGIMEKVPALAPYLRDPAFRYDPAGSDRQDKWNLQPGPVFVSDRP